MPKTFNSYHMNNSNNTMQQEAERILSDIHNNEHRETMRLYSLIHNGLLLVVFFILFLVFPNWLTVAVFLFCWDYTYTKEFFQFIKKALKK